MPYPLADALHQQLLDAFPPGRPYDRPALEAPGLPRLVGHYLRHRLQRRVDGELGRLRSARSEVFDHHHPDVQAAYEQYAATLTAHARIPADAWATSLREAADHVTAYLVRPADTLAEVLYEDADGPLPTHRVLQGMAAFAAYPYLRDVLTAYVEQRDAERFDAGRLATLLTRIDREMTRAHAPDEWLELLRPLFDLARHAGLDALPTPTLRAFFATRGADAIERRLAAAERDGADRLDETDLRPLLAPPPEPAVPPAPRTDERSERSAPDAPPAERTLPVPERAAPERTSPERRTAPERPSSAPAPPAGAEPSAPPGEPSAVPLWKKFQQVTPPSDPPPARTPARRAPAAPAPAPSTPAGGAVPLWKRFRNDTDPERRDAGDASSSSGRASREPAPTPSRTDLAALERDVLGSGAAEDRRRYVRDLFGGSEADYAAVLARLRASDSWADASGIIARDVFRRYGVNIYSDVAVAFTDAAERRFR